jgi:hypothetical protein
VEPDLLVLDDLFLARRISEHAAQVLQAIVHQRYKLRRSGVVSSNRVVQDCGRYLGDATMATTILDRLMHRCTTLEFEGKSYRRKEAAARIAISPEPSQSVELELTRYRGHIILCVQGVANVQSTTAVPGGVSPADGRAGSSGSLSRAALA